MILVSGFAPFDIDPENSTELIVKAAEAEAWPGVEYVILPVSFAKAWSVLSDAIRRVRPDLVLSLGQADRRTQISLERVALNWIDARIPDEDGQKPVDEKVQKLGPLALPSRLPTRFLVDQLKRRGFAAELSYSAGTFVCNALMYDLLYWAEAQDKKAGFIHYPLLREQKLGQGREMLRPEAKLELREAVGALKCLIDELR